MGDAEPRRMTVEDYFRLEETSPIRHEYVAGELYAMSGATARHNRIAGNIFARLLPLARAGPCDACPLLRSAGPRGAREGRAA